MRNASGSKFSLGSAFGRKSERTPSYSGNDFGQPQASPSAPTNNGDEPSSPGPRESGPGPTFDGFGKKLGKTFAHQSLLPALANKDVRALQDVISHEKGVLNHVERLAIESSKASGALPNYGLQEGPDLHDILTQSSVLLNHLASSLNTFAERETSLRVAFKRIREREEALGELRSRRRTTGNKAETAEKKLAKMGPENKALPSQTELLESLRYQMRSMDSEIVNEESSIGDFKRQTVKEALSYKFAGLEELGEKLCIIGELGKLVIEEIPLEETPPGYGRAPYTGFAKTESAVEEAGRCLSQVKFNPVNYELKASHLPLRQHSVGRDLPGQEQLAAAEEYGNEPEAAAAPQRHPHFALDENPYGGLDGRHESDNHAYREYGGLRTDDTTIQQAQHGQHAQGHVVWQGPTEEALAQRNGHDGAGAEYGRERIASMYAAETPGQGQGYEYEQQAELDRQHREEQAAWREGQAGDAHAGSPAAPVPPATDGATPIAADDMPNPYAPQPWQPLNVHKDAPREDNAAPTTAAYDYDAAPAPPAMLTQDELAPPPTFGQMGLGRSETPREGDGTEGFRTPNESPNLPTTQAIPDNARTPSPLPPIPGIQDPAARGPSPRPSFPASALPTNGNNDIPPPSPSLLSPGGKISAGAFRKPTPRRSETAASGVTVGDEDEFARTVRRLPVPPGGFPGAPGGPGVAGPSSGAGAAPPVSVTAPGGWPDEKRAMAEQEQRAQTQTQTQTDTQTPGGAPGANTGAFEDAPGHHDAPPSYPSESLR